MDCRKALFLAILIVGCANSTSVNVATRNNSPNLKVRDSSDTSSVTAAETTPDYSSTSDSGPASTSIATTELDTGETTENPSGAVVLFPNVKEPEVVGTRQTMLMLRNYTMTGTYNMSCRQREYDQRTEYKRVAVYNYTGTNCPDSTLGEIPTFPGEIGDNWIRYSFVESYYPISHMVKGDTSSTYMYLGTLANPHYKYYGEMYFEGYQVSNEIGEMMVVLKQGGVLNALNTHAGEDGFKNAEDGSMMPFSRVHGNSFGKFQDIKPARGSTKARITARSNESESDVKIEQRFDSNSDSCGHLSVTAVCMTEGEISAGHPFMAEIEFAMSDHSVERNFSVFNCNSVLKVKDMNLCDCPRRSVCYMKEGVKHVLTRLEKCPGTFLGYKPVRFANIWHFMSTPSGALKGRFVDPVAFTEYGLIELNVQDPAITSLINREYGGWTWIPMRWCADMKIGVVVENKEAIIRATRAELDIFQEYMCNGLSVSYGGEDYFSVNLPFSQRTFNCDGKGLSHDPCLALHPGEGRTSSVARNLCRNYSDEYVIWGLAGPLIFLLGIPWLYMIAFWVLSKCSNTMNCLYCIMRVKQRLWVYKGGMTESEEMRVRHFLIRKTNSEGEPQTLQHGDEAVEESNALIDYIAEDHSRWYKVVCSMQVMLRPVYYTLILIAYIMTVVMIIPAAIVGMIMAFRGDKTKTKKGKLRDWFVYILMIQMSIVQVRSERSKMFNFQPPEVHNVGTTIKFQEDCSSSECLASFLQNFPMLAVPGYTITAGIEDSSGDVVGGITYKVENVEISSVMTYDYSIWTVTESITNEITDGNDDCDGDNDTGWNCNEQNNLACLLYHNEFKSGMSGYHGSWKDLGDRGKSLYTPSSFGFCCPKGIWAASTATNNGQRYRIQWYPQNKESPVVRVYNIPVMTNMITVSVEVIIGETKLMEEIQVDLLGLINDIDSHMSVNAVSWSSSDLSGQRIGCLYSSSDAASPEICYTGFEGYQAKTRFIKAVGEMWGQDVDGKLVEGVPEFYNWPGESYNWGNYFATVSSDLIASWTRTDIASLGSSVADISGCSFKVEQLEKTQQVAEKEVCEIWGRSPDDCGSGGKVKITTVKPRQAKIVMDNCPRKNFELTTHIKEWPYTAQGAVLEVIDPGVVSMSAAGCYDLNSMLEVTIRVPEGTKPGILLLQSGTIIMESAIWLEDLSTVRNATALNGDNLWIYGMTTKGEKTSISPTIVKMEICESYSNPNNPNQTEDGIEGKALKWWEILLIVLGCVAAMILIGLIVMCYLRYSMTKEVGSSFTKFIVPSLGESKPEPKTDRMKTFLRKRNVLRKSRLNKISAESEMEPLIKDTSM